LTVNNHQNKERETMNMNARTDISASISKQIAPIVAANAAAKAARFLPSTPVVRRGYSVPSDNIKAPGAMVGADGIAFVGGYDAN